MDSGFQNMSDTARGTGLVSHVTDPPFDAASAFRIGNPASTLILRSCQIDEKFERVKEIVKEFLKNSLVRCRVWGTKMQADRLE